jgi:hypothetical protein
MTENYMVRTDYCPRFAYVHLSIYMAKSTKENIQLRGETLQGKKDRQELASFSSWRLSETSQVSCA